MWAMAGMFWSTDHNCIVVTLKGTTIDNYEEIMLDAAIQVWVKKVRSPFVPQYMLNMLCVANGRSTVLVWIMPSRIL